MIKVGDVVILKEMNEINFKNLEEQLRYVKLVYSTYIRINNEYKVTIRLSKLPNSQIRCYQIGLIDINTNSANFLLPMTWFRNSALDKILKRNNKIKKILK